MENKEKILDKKYAGHCNVCKWITEDEIISCDNGVNVETKSF